MPRRCKRAELGDLVANIFLKAIKRVVEEKIVNINFKNG